MWGGSNMSGAPRIATYGDAAMAWERAGTWRKQPDHVRILTARRHDNKQIVRHSDGAIALRLYDTNVVTYKPDGDVVLSPYHSRMTDQFAPYFLPDGVYGCFNRGAVGVRKDKVWSNDYRAWWRETRYYRLRNPTVLRRTEGDYPWAPVEAPPWKRRFIDREKMRVAARECGLTEFAAAAPAMFAITGHTGRTFTPYANNQSRNTRVAGALAMLRAGPSEWLGFVTRPEPPRRCAFDGDPPYVLSTLIAKLRVMVADEAGAWREEHYPFVTGGNQWRAAMKDAW